MTPETLSEDPDQPADGNARPSPIQSRKEAAPARLNRIAGAASTRVRLLLDVLADVLDELTGLPAPAPDCVLRLAGRLVGGAFVAQLLVVG